MNTFRQIKSNICGLNICGKISTVNFYCNYLPRTNTESICP